MTPHRHEGETCQEKVIYSPIKNRESLESSSISSPTPNKQSSASSSSVQVAVRIRPFLPSEAGSTKCVDVIASTNDESSSTPTGQGSSSRYRVVRVGGTDGPTFTFDRALPNTTSQVQVYDSCVSPLVIACLGGYNATVLAYGQTGSGKTFTILGSSIHEQGIMGGEEESTFMGVIPRALRDLFGRLQSRKSEQLPVPESKMEEVNDGEQREQREGDLPPFEYEVRIQFLELYGEEIRDLLSPSSGQRLAIRDGGNGVEPEVIGATETTVVSAEEALLCLHRGSLRRVTGATAMNAESSRSHAIMSVIIEQTTTSGGGAIEGEGSNEQLEVEVKRSKFHFVDLAGSERQKKSLAEGKRLKEGIDINKGLLVLGNVISALGDPKKRGKAFVPYRDSKLTRLLKGSLGGNHKTLMIACVSPSSKNMEETLNCLRYANRAKNIQNKAVVNVDANSRLVGELRENVKSLATELLRVRNFCADDYNIYFRDSPFSSEVLMSMSQGNDCPNAGAKVNKSKEPTTVSQQSNGASRDEVFRAELRLAESETELRRVRDMLRQTKQQLYATSEQLFAEKAEKEYYRLQLSSEKREPGDTEYIERMEEKAKNILMNGDDQSPDKMSTDSPGAFPTNDKSEFVRRIAAYEKELAKLRDELKDERCKSAKYEKDQTKSQFTPPSSPYEVGGGGRHSISSSVTNTPPPALPFSEPKTPPSMSSLQKALKKRKEQSHELDEEERTEKNELLSLTNKYVPDSDESSVEDSENRQNINNLSEVEQKDLSFQRRQKHMDAHLSELTKGISAKEELLEQLTSTQNKYEVMRGFYEDKLRQMEVDMNSHKREREDLNHELARLKATSKSIANNASIKKLQATLEGKESLISSLRKKQTELTNLTKISNRNLDVIQRLQSDLQQMKRSKVELQKQIMSERKTHAAEIKHLQQLSRRKDHEVTKWKRELNKKTVAAEKAAKVAKTRLAEVGTLRTKYVEAEKRLRMQTLKKGVLERVGVDSVMRGGRSKSWGRQPAKNGSKKTKRPDWAKIRNYVEEKVADVGRKETIADKIASEWEDHLELVSRKRELLGDGEDGERSNTVSEEELEALDAQLKYKEKRIRQLTVRLGERSRTASREGERRGKVVQESFLEDREFKTICVGATPLVAAQATSKVLFGMVVKERRRVAHLARTACHLDQKATEAENLAASKDEALRSHMEEQRHERATMAKEQQGQILSLMTIVRQEEEGCLDDEDETIDLGNFEGRQREERPSTLSEITTDMSTQPPENKTTNKTSSSGRLMLILANERIQVLESQLSEMQGEIDAKESYKSRVDNLNTSLEDKQRECSDLKREVKNLRTSLQKVRRTLSRSSLPSYRRGNSSRSLTEDDTGPSDEHTIRSERTTRREKANFLQSSPERHTTTKIGDIVEIALTDSLSPRSKSIERILLHSDESLDDEEPAPEWAEDILADVAMIAEGIMPPSLIRKNGKSSAGDDSDVFDRLTDPHNFTGVQKHSFLVKKPVAIKKGSSDRRDGGGGGNGQQSRSKMQTKGSGGGGFKSRQRNSSSESTISRDESMEGPTEGESSEHSPSGLSLASIAESSRRSIFSPDKKEVEIGFPPETASSGGVRSSLDDSSKSSNLSEGKERAKTPPLVASPTPNKNRVATSPGQNFRTPHRSSGGSGGGSGNRGNKRKPPRNGNFSSPSNRRGYRNKRTSPKG